MLWYSSKRRSARSPGVFNSRKINCILWRKCWWIVDDDTVRYVWQAARSCREKPEDRAGSRLTHCFWSTRQVTWTTITFRGTCSDLSAMWFSTWMSTLVELGSPSSASAIEHRWGDQPQWLISLINRPRIRDVTSADLHVSTGLSVS